MKALRRLLTLLSIVLLLLSGCDDDDAQLGSLIVGVTSDYRAGVDLVNLDVELSVDGEVISQSSLLLGASSSATDFPVEFKFEDVTVGSTVAITLRGYDSVEMRVVRHMETVVDSTEQRLVRVHLESDCMLVSPGGNAPAGAPTCNETSQTCIAGTCQSATVPGSEQAPYTPGWAGSFSDICKPAEPGPPEVIVGHGQSDYLPMADDDVANVEAGPQGGHHIWVAARVKNLHQSGSITEVGGEIPSLGVSITPLKVIFTMDPDEGGYCKLFGLRFQIDVDGNDVNALLGERMKIIISVTDVNDDVGTGERWVMLSDSITG
jgi:hypothetical protein